MAAHYARLNDEGLLHISGPDTLTFLQGQTTCDTRKVDTAQCVPGAYCTPKGRMVCDFLLAKLGDEQFALRMRADIIEPAAAAFGKYIMFSKATLDPARDDWKVFACWGDGAARALQGLDAKLPSSRYGVSSGEGFSLIQVDDKGEQFEVYINTQTHPQHVEIVQQGMNADTEQAWQVLQVASGIARVEAQTVEEFLPQVLNYDVTGHVSFDKGCYTGQEIVARLHYRGKSKRRLYLAHLADSVPLPAGSDLFSPGSAQASGTVVNSAPTDTGCVCLVSATEAGVAAGLQVSGSDDALQIDDLPYTVPD